METIKDVSSSAFNYRKHITKFLHFRKIIFRIHCDPNISEQEIQIRLFRADQNVIHASHDTSSTILIGSNSEVR
jgi:hypothetical protein